MEELTRAAWDFMTGAYKKGLLDEILALSGGMLNPDTDLGEVLGDMEDTLSAADFAPFEEKSKEIIIPALQALSEEEVIEALMVLITTLRPLLERAVQNAGGDPGVIPGMAENIKKNLIAAKTVVNALLPVLAKGSGPLVEKFLKEKAGGMAAEAVNTACRAMAREPETVSRFVSALFAGVDRGAFKTAASTVAGAVMEQRPPLVRWTASMVAGMTRKRLLGGRYGSS